MENRQLNYFSRADFLNFDAKTGVLRSPGGTRLVAVNEDWLRGFVRACEHEVGPATGLILRRCGSFFGARLAQRFEAELNAKAGLSLRDRPMAEFGALLVDMWTSFGMGELTVDWRCGAKGFLPARLGGSPMTVVQAQHATGEELMAGLLEGFMGHFCGQHLVAVETGAEKRGAEATTFVLVTRAQLERVRARVEAKISHAQIVKELEGSA